MTALFTVQLEAQDGSGHFRRSTIAAESAEEAKATLAAREEEFTLFRLTTDEIADLAKEHGSDLIGEALDAGPAEKMPSALPAAVRSKLALHRQAKPYKVVSVKAQGE